VSEPAHLLEREGDVPGELLVDLRAAQRCRLENEAVRRPLVELLRIAAHGAVALALDRDQHLRHAGADLPGCRGRVPRRVFAEALGHVASTSSTAAVAWRVISRTERSLRPATWGVRTTFGSVSRREPFGGSSANTSSAAALSAPRSSASASASSSTSPPR